MNESFSLSWWEEAGREDILMGTWSRRIRVESRHRALRGQFEGQDYKKVAHTCRLYLGILSNVKRKTRNCVVVSFTDSKKHGTLLSGMIFDSRIRNLTFCLKSDRLCGIAGVGMKEREDNI